MEMMVNGNEGVCYNFRVNSGTFNPSIEIYRFTPGELSIRYMLRPIHPSLDIDVRAARH